MKLSIQTLTSLVLAALLGLASLGCQAAQQPETPPVAPLAAPTGSLFRVYLFDFAGADPQPNFDGIANPAKKFSVVRDASGAQVTVEEPGTWRGFWAVGSLGQWAGYQPLFGGERLHLTYSASPGAQVVLSVQYFGGVTFDIAAPNDIKADGQMHEIQYTLPADANGKKLVAVWLRVDNAGTGTAQVRLGQFAWDRRRIDNRLNADRILASPPVHNARVAPVRGAMAITIDGKPVTGLGWASILNNTTGDEELKQIVGDSGFKLSRLDFTLGEPVYLDLYPPSWLGPDQYDFSFLDTQMARLMKANPDTKTILHVALDGARWWTWMHPQATVTIGKGQSGIPDYLSPEWVRDSREAIRQMVAHVQTSSYANAVVGYDLFNGATMDSNYWVELFTPRATERYRAFLRTRYETDKALQTAWHDPRATIATARIPLLLDKSAEPVLVSPTEWTAPQVASRFSLLLEPARNRKLVDEITFHHHEYHQVILNFARDIKEATHNRAITGARTGDFMGNAWLWPDPFGYQIPAISELLHSPNFDYFEVQEPYVGRGIADYGTGVPILPPKGLMGHNKLIVIQNDVRTHLSDPGEGYGRTPDLPSTIQMQRRIFVNSLALGMSEYLWQMSYHYNDPAMLADFRKMERIGEKAFQVDRSSGAQVAFVYDENYRKFFGYDPLKSAPSRGFALFDYLKFSWARAGVPFDQIFLDQLPQAKQYKMYVFVHTVGLTDAQQAMIKSVVRRQGRVSIFLWADGLIDGERINAAKMGDLVGMKVVMSSEPATWKMSATPWFQSRARVLATEPLGTLPINEPAEPSASDNTYAPSFFVDDPKSQAIGVYDVGNPLAGKVGIALRQTPQWSSIYSASVNLRPVLLRYAAQLAGVFQYADSDDASYINNSFIGFNARQTHDIHLRLPRPSALYEVFSGQELPSDSVFSIPVVRGNTYLYFRGSKAQWEALGRPKGAVAVQ